MDDVKLREIDGSEGKYFVGDNGEVYNRLGKKLKPTINGTGYKMVVLYMPKIGKKYYFVHKLVCEHFVVKTGMKFPVGFKDEDKNNCTPSNLVIKP